MHITQCIAHKVCIEIESRLLREKFDGVRIRVDGLDVLKEHSAKMLQQRWAEAEPHAGVRVQCSRHIPILPGVPLRRLAAERAIHAVA